MKTALLMSGGMDSTALLWWKKPDLAIAVDYGQLAAEAEKSAAGALCKRVGVPLSVVEIDCSSLGSGDMAGQKPDTLAPASDWWPYRNQLLITLASMRAIVFGIERLWIGTVRSDAGHLDGTAGFISNISTLLEGQEGGLVVEAPAITMTTAELVQVSGIPLEVLAWSHSCHKANVACGNCRGCNKYFSVFRELGHALD
jgi:7-cyano-7-deazaguanine synthase